MVPACRRLFARGGVNSWQNLVTACMTCNQRKGDKSLQHLGWKLPKVPEEPTPQQLGVLAGISKVRGGAVSVVIVVAKLLSRGARGYLWSGLVLPAGIVWQWCVRRWHLSAPGLEVAKGA
jgi:hypothetical protein